MEFLSSSCCTENRLDFFAIFLPILKAQCRHSVLSKLSPVSGHLKRLPKKCNRVNLTVNTHKGHNCARFKYNGSLFHCGLEGS
jgi:hypothetical protein